MAPRLDSCAGPPRLQTLASGRVVLPDGLSPVREVPCEIPGFGGLPQAHSQLREHVCGALLGHV